MNILIICSKRFYNRIAKIKELLEVNGHHPFMPNCYDDPGTEDRIKSIGEEEHQKFIDGILEYGNEWKKVQQIIKTRSSTQARSHAQKFFLKLKN